MPWVNYIYTHTHTLECDVLILMKEPAWDDSHLIWEACVCLNELLILVYVDTYIAMFDKLLLMNCKMSRCVWWVMEWGLSHALQELRRADFLVLGDIVSMHSHMIIYVHFDYILVLFGLRVTICNQWLMLAGQSYPWLNWPDCKPPLKWIW